MPKTVLLTIGRMPKALDFARSFHAAGWRVVVADPFRWHLTRTSRAVAKTYAVPAPADNPEAYLAELRVIINRERVDLVVPVSEETMYVAALRNGLPDGVELFAMPQERLLALHSKLAFIDTARSLGLAAPRTHPLGDPLAGSIAAAGDYVIKPVFSCSGRGVEFFERNTPLPQPRPGDPAVVQQRIDGELFSTFSIAQRGEVRVTVVYRAAVMSGTVAVCFERVEYANAIEKWVSAFAAKTNHTGFISFDMIVDATGRAFAIECNPRSTSGVHFVNRDFLAPAILDQPTSAEPFRDAKFMQQFYPCLTETQKSFFGDWRFRSNLQHLTSASDVTFSLRDPLPFLLMPATASQIIRRSIAKKQSFGEASTFDISWRPPA